MTDEHAEALATYARFFETLTPARVVFLRDLAVPDVRFKDPFNDVRGVEPMIAAISSMYRHGTPRFEVIDRATGEVGAGYLLWRCTIVPDGLRSGWTFEGMSSVRFDPAGRVVEHIDHWDASEQFFERLPVIGMALRLIKRGLAARWRTPRARYVDERRSSPYR
jgi:steroid delta-isomerase